MDQIRGRSLARLQEWLARARRVIPSCTQTFSKGPTQWVQGVAPLFLERGRGSHVWDVDGNEYVDYVMALGPIVLGYDDPDVIAAVQRQLADGVVFSLAHPLEVEVAEMLAKVVPCAEMVRFGKNGSDATSGAVRAARAHTGRDVIACCGYHGWQDWYIGTTSRRRGVPDAVCRLGIAKTFQIPQLFPRLTVAENVLVAALYGRGAGLHDAWREAREWVGFVGLADKARMPAETLSVSERRRADLARVLATGASLILLDENMAGLNQREVEAAVALLLAVRARGRSLVVTEHIMRAILGLADRVVVLNYGEKISEGRPADVMRDATVLKAYLGEGYG